MDLSILFLVPIELNSKTYSKGSTLAMCFVLYLTIEDMLFC